MKPLELYSCPRCHNKLNLLNRNLFCNNCNQHYYHHSDGYMDLRINDERYADYLSMGEELKDMYIKQTAPTEKSGAIHMMEEYLIPLLKDLNLQGDTKILSVGCGGGWDVEALHNNGFQTWGIDNGGRTFNWKDIFCADYLSLSDALHLPFSDDSFDFVFSEGTIEHIGFTGDNYIYCHDWKERRIKFAQEQLRITKPGGYIFVACPNKLFPIDLYHGGKHTYKLGGLSLRFHSPKENFLLSFADIKNLYSDGICWIKTLTLKNFFNTSRLMKTNKSMRVLIPIINILFDWLPTSYFRSPLCPYLVVLIKKTSIS